MKSKKIHRPNWTIQQQTILDENYGSMALKNIAAKIGKTERAVIRRVWYLRKIEKLIIDKPTHNID